MATTAPGGLDVRTHDRWEPIRCIEGKRIADGNGARRRIRVKCDGCRTIHRIDLDTLEVVRD